MSNVDTLHKRIAALLAAINQRQEQRAIGRIIIYNPALPKPTLPVGTGVTILLPDNGRGDAYA